ncbi:hypothetical protein, conserved [Plasmodium gonderi]|uniref:Uncharacterized protein n=1 Tax=Plasmodium gonderi TaxID=77519 RepID=A0A1Y1JRL9_PLAGO|nr:hypothetical protein, conserved [Plasmodium gonderi]GAW83847.1 hypothetical protein, conserved [Plasmodium gonderi]
MKGIGEFYAYSMDKCTSVFNLKKKEEINRKKKTEISWVGKVFSEFEKTKNDTFEYISVQKNYWKKKFSDSKFSSYCKHENSKYENLPWYKKLYQILKGYICNLLNIVDHENMETKRKDQGEFKNKVLQRRQHENKINREFVSFENLDYKNKQKSKNTDDNSLFKKYRERFRKTKENETHHSERSQSELVKRNISPNSILSVPSNKSIMLDNKKLMKDENALVNTDKEEETRNKANDGDSDKENESDHEVKKNDRKSFLNVENSPKFNIKNTWEKLSGYIS